MMFVPSRVRKWLGRKPSIELLTPNSYLIDFIELSGIKQEVAIDSLHEKYEKYGLTLRELATGSVHSRDTIADRMRESGMKVRKPGGPKQVIKVGVLYSSEDLYKLVRAKREKGPTYRKIAQDLTVQNIICKKGANHWHPMMVKRIMDF